MDYRADIDGLRGLAILFVVFFHYDVFYIPAGFLGVDIFFVISGYLITGMVARAVTAGTFDILGFYRRRAARLFPIFSIVLFCCLLFGFLALSPQALKSMGGETIYSASFLSNIYYSLKTDYWADPESSSFLIHTWSLSVEEQYYLFIPLVIVACAKLRSGSILPVMLFIFCISISITFLLRDVPERFLFYLTPFRMLELTLGGLAVLSPSWRGMRQIPLVFFSTIALLSLVTAVFYYSEQHAFPGVAAILVSIASVILLKSGENQFSYVRKVLSGTLLRNVGLISYSLYLWHWPVLIAASRITGGKLEFLDRMFCLAISVFLSIMSYFLVEKKCRQFARRADVSSSIILSIMIGPLVLLFVAGYSLKKFDGMPSRIPAELSSYTSTKFNSGPRKNCMAIRGRSDIPENCAFGPENSQKNILFWGDSHATVYAPVLDQFSESSGFRVRLLSKGGCPPLLGVVVFRGDEKRESCQIFNENAQTLILNTQPDLVVLAGRWHKYAGEFESNAVMRNRLEMPSIDTNSSVAEGEILEFGLQNTLNYLANKGVPVLLLGPTADFIQDPNDCVVSRKMLGLDIEACDVKYDEMLQRVGSALKIVSKFNAIRPTPSLLKSLCTDGFCRTSYLDEPIYLDSHHLDVVGASLVFPTIQKAMYRALR